MKNVTNILRERLFLGWGEERESFEKIVFMEMETEAFIQAGVEQEQSRGVWQERGTCESNWEETRWERCMVESHGSPGRRGQAAYTN